VDSPQDINRYFMTARDYQLNQAHRLFLRSSLYIDSSTSVASRAAS
jgi:hypothetical protein